MQYFLASVKAIVTSKESDYMILGDLICDFKRESAHTVIITEFMIKNNLENASNYFSVDYMFGWVSALGVNGYNTIDHFIFKRTMIFNSVS